jgi:hypothetical protein
MTVHAPDVDYSEHKRADAPPAWLRSDKQALPRLPHALYLLYCDGNPSYSSLRALVHQRMIQYTETELDLGHPLRIKTGQEARL